MLWCPVSILKRTSIGRGRTLSHPWWNNLGIGPQQKSAQIPQRTLPPVCLSSWAHCFRYFIHSFIFLHCVGTIERLLKSSQKWILRGWLSHYYMRAALRDSLRRMYFLTANWGCNFYWHGYSEESFQPLWYGWRCCAPAWVGLFRLQRPQKSPSTEAAMHCSIRKPWAYQSHTLSTKLLTVFLNQLMPAFVDVAMLLHL